MEFELVTIDLLENPANGIGDAILFAWLAQAASHAGIDLPLYLDRHHDWLVPMPSVRPMLTHTPGRIARGREDEWKRLTGRERELRDAGKADHRLDAWAQAYELDVLQFVAPAVEVRERDAEFADRQWDEARRHLGRDGSALRTLVFPNCAWPQRSWPRSYWSDLARSMHHAGLCPVVMASSADEHRTCAYPYSVHGNTPGECWAMLENADLVIAADTGPAHAAVTMGRPTVVFQGPTRVEWVFGHALECVTGVDAGHVVPCTGCDLDAAKGFRAACHHGCQSLFQLTPTMALQAVLAITQRQAVAA